ncbi:MAG: hypothetical protein RIS70_1102 [Planctomycetota bacterium]|jgi:hypothetical protein
MATINQRQWSLFLGLVLIVSGLVLRGVESATLTPEATRMLAQISGPPAESVQGQLRQVVLDTNAVRKVVQPPKWLGWLLLSLGGFLAAYSVRPGS